jgi:hypothetical protein
VSTGRSLQSRTGGYSPSHLECELTEVLIRDTERDRGIAALVADRYAQDHNPRDRKMREGCMKSQDMAWGVGRTHLPV